MFVNYGIKRKDLESDLDFAFSLFKKVIVGLGSENKLKNSSLDKIEHTFLPPAEREKARRQEEAALAKLNSKRTIKKKPPPKKTPKNFAAGKRTSVPLAPPPPPPPPPPPSAVPTVPNVPNAKTPAASKRSSMPEVDRATQLKNIQLKKVGAQKVAKETENNKDIAGNGKNFLQNALSTAIMNRRKNLHMHDDEDDEEEDDWD